MKQKINKNNVKELLFAKFGDNFSYEKLDYKTSKEKICIVCKKHNVAVYNTAWRFLNIIKTNPCPVCGTAREHDIVKREKNLTKRYIEIIHKKNNNIIIPTDFKYTSIHDKCTLCCKKHGKFSIYIGNIRASKTICQKCSFQKNNRDEKIMNFIKKSKDIYGDKFDYCYLDEDYQNCKTDVRLLCKKHNIVFKVKPMSHISYKRVECPLCKNSRHYYEEFFMSLLAEKNIQYEHEYKIIKNNVYFKNKPYDFFIPSLNLIIELNGTQHYMRKFNMSEEDLINRKKIDELKKENAINNGYNFLIIKDLTHEVLKYVIDIISTTKNIIFENETFKNNILYIQADGNKRHE